MPPESTPTDLRTAVRETAAAMGLDAGDHAAAVPLALASEPLVTLRDRIEAAHAAAQPDLLHGTADALHAAELGLRTGVRLALEAFAAFDHQPPDWLRRLDRLVRAEFPEPPAGEGEGEEKPE